MYLFFTCLDYDLHLHKLFRKKFEQVFFFVFFRKMTSRLLK